jgi:hypothetical protein
VLLSTEAEIESAIGVRSAAWRVSLGDFLRFGGRVWMEVFRSEVAQISNLATQPIEVFLVFFDFAGECEWRQFAKCNHAIGGTEVAMLVGIILDELSEHQPWCSTPWMRISPR